MIRCNSMSLSELPDTFGGVSRASNVAHSGYRCRYLNWPMSNLSLIYETGFLIKPTVFFFSRKNALSIFCRIFLMQTSESALES